MRTTTLIVLDGTGHTTITDTPDVIAQKFAKIMEDGGAMRHVAFDTTSTPGTRMTTFDPAAEEITITGHFVGG